jgi:hypothetical protein
MDGICTLANDRVFDQVIALLNSIEVVMGKAFPVCIYPYDDNTTRLQAEITHRPQVCLYDDRSSIESWDNFCRGVWEKHPNAFDRWQKAGSSSYHRFGTFRRYGAFDAPFDQFLYMDADTLLLRDAAPIFEKLVDCDCVVYDFQHKDLSHVYDIDYPHLTQVFSQKRLQTEIFCSGFYASKKNLFPPEKREWLLSQLNQGDAPVLYPMAPDQTVINYMMMRSGAKIYNFALELPQEKVTGCCVTSPHFTEDNHQLYDKGVPLIYLHYIGLSSRLFERVCQGENIDFPYRDLFLYYRYCQQPEQLPKFTTKAKAYNTPPSLMDKIVGKLGIKFNP